MACGSPPQVDFRRANLQKVARSPSRRNERSPPPHPLQFPLLSSFCFLPASGAQASYGGADFLVAPGMSKLSLVALGNPRPVRGREQMVEVGGVEPPSRKASDATSTAIAGDFYPPEAGSPLQAGFFRNPGDPSANAPDRGRPKVSAGQPIPRASSLHCLERPSRTLGRRGAA